MEKPAGGKSTLDGKPSSLAVSQCVEVFLIEALLKTPELQLKLQGAGLGTLPLDLKLHIPLLVSLDNHHLRLRLGHLVGLVDQGAHDEP